MTSDRRPVWISREERDALAWAGGLGPAWPGDNDPDDPNHPAGHVRLIVARYDQAADPPNDTSGARLVPMTKAQRDWLADYYDDPDGSRNVPAELVDLFDAASPVAADPPNDTSSEACPHCNYGIADGFCHCNAKPASPVAPRDANHISIPREQMELLWVMAHHKALTHEQRLDHIKDWLSGMWPEDIPGALAALADHPQHQDGE